MDAHIWSNTRKPRHGASFNGGVDRVCGLFGPVGASTRSDAAGQEVAPTRLVVVLRCIFSWWSAWPVPAYALMRTKRPSGKRRRLRARITLRKSLAPGNPISAGLLPQNAGHSSCGTADRAGPRKVAPCCDLVNPDWQVGRLRKPGPLARLTTRRGC